MKAFSIDDNDGTAEILLGPDDPILSEYNVKGTAILRETRGTPLMYIVEKDYDEILEECFIDKEK